MARSICLTALTGAPKTRQQLAELLARREVPVDAAEAVLDRFTEVGLIDDVAFAAAWVSSRQSGRGLARRALAAELRAKGVDVEVAAEAVAVVDVEVEREAAQQLVERKLRAMSRLDRTTAERRLIGMLTRKGYGGGLAGSVVRAALDERSATSVDEPPAGPAGAFSARDRRTAGGATDGFEDERPGDERPGRLRPRGRGQGTATRGGMPVGDAGVGGASDDDVPRDDSQDDSSDGTAPEVTPGGWVSRRRARAAQDAEAALAEATGGEVGEGHVRAIGRHAGLVPDDGD
jgi:regulatory protein